MPQSQPPAPSVSTTFAEQIDQIHADLAVWIDQSELSDPLSESVPYAVSGGKCVRALLCRLVFEDLCVSPTHQQTNMMRRACIALELIHAYSLVHDDMPCMDDDELRRGKPTAHVQFGEAVAMLSGDVLQTLAFEVLSFDELFDVPPDAVLCLQLTQQLSSAARKMVNGQMRDLLAETEDLSELELTELHLDKTGALIQAAVVMGAVCAGAKPLTLDVLGGAAAKIGLIFQILDDVLDVTATTEELGKPQGSDVKLGKSTYVTLMGVEGAKAKAESLNAWVMDELSSVLPELNRTKMLVQMLAGRQS